MITRYVVGFAFDKTESEVALILKARPSWQAGSFNGIGGHIEDDETPQQAIEREFEEEAPGINIINTWRQVALLIGKDYHVFFFRANAELDGLECSSEREIIIAVSPDDLPVNVLPDLRWLIPMARVCESRDWPFRIEERKGCEE